MLEASKELKEIIGAAEEAGAGLIRRFGARERLVVELKGPQDFVSEADRESERTLQTRLLRAFPSHGFVTEESPPTAASASSRFIVDPLDGTTNFVHGIPHFAIAVALERDAEIVAGVVYDVPKREMFVAERGRGAWLGGTRLQVSTDRELSRALVGTGIPHANAKARHAKYLAMLAGAMKEAAGIRRFAAAAIDLAYVAAGRFAVFFEMGLSPWDVAAGSLLVQEAGGRVTEPDGGEDYIARGNVLATNGHLHPRMMKMLARASRPAASPKPQRRTTRRA
ncbi:MAG TPA: inositol monophosphatase family protein [Polyangiaceae bacterium]|nr:inositol monophosphatase family protein [Polyangiaceae bacterium]